MASPRRKGNTAAIPTSASPSKPNIVVLGVQLSEPTLQELKQILRFSKVLTSNGAPLPKINQGDLIICSPDQLKIIRSQNPSLHSNQIVLFTAQPTENIDWLCRVSNEESLIDFLKIKFPH